VTDCAGLVTATRGNHGQSIAFAAQRYGVPVTIVVPHGNAREKNAAMPAFGADLVEHGRDFDEARAHAAALAQDQKLSLAPSFHSDTVCGVATYAIELFLAHPDLARVLVPIGLGSGICGVIGVRDLFNLKTQIVGVVSGGADCYAQSLEQGRPAETQTANTFADGLAVRVPNAEALAIITKGAARVVRVSDAEIADAIRVLHEDTHHLAEGAGAAALAGLLQEKPRGKSAFILCGGNIDRDVAAQVLAGETPQTQPKS
jgi:threonine dehydratase